MAFGISGRRSTQQSPANRSICTCPRLTRNTTLAYTENDPATAIAPAGVTTDLDSPNYNGGSLTIHITAAALQDQLSILTDVNVTVSSGTVSVGGLAIGTVSGGANGADLVVSFNGAATQ